MRHLIKVAYLLMLALTSSWAKVDAQLIFLQRENEPIKPFVAPDATDRMMAKRNHIKSTLRFGYLSYNKDAESLRRRTEYNTEGYPTTTYDFSTDGKIEAKKEFIYDQSGTKIVKATTEQYLPNGDLQYLLHYAFSPTGKLLEYREIDAHGFERRMNYTYDAQERLLRLQYIEPDGLPGGAEVYQYLIDGLVSMDKTDIAGDLIERVTWTIDKKDKIMGETRYTGGESPILLFSYLYTYDAKGRMIRKEKMNRDQVVNGWESWTYDSYGRLTEHKMLETGDSKPMREALKYDSQGRKTQSITYNTDGSIFQWYKYSYDSLGMGAGLERLLPDGKTDLKQMATFNKARQVLTQEETYPDGSGSNTVIYRYRDDGLLLDEKHYSLGKEEAVYWFVHEPY